MQIHLYSQIYFHREIFSILKRENSHFGLDLAIMMEKAVARSEFIKFYMCATLAFSCRRALSSWPIVVVFF